MSLELLLQKKFFQFGIPSIEYIPLEYEDMVLSPLYGKDVLVYELIDGMAATYYSVLNPRLCGKSFKSGIIRLGNALLQQFSLGIDSYCEGVCSRSRDFGPVLLQKNGDYYHEIEQKYGIFTALHKLKRNLAVQGIVYGEKIQGNPQGISGRDCAVFGIFDVDRQLSLPSNEVHRLCRLLKLPLLPELYAGRLNLNVFFELRNFVRSPAQNGSPRKGIMLVFADSVDADRILALKASKSPQSLKNDFLTKIA